MNEQYRFDAMGADAPDEWAIPDGVAGVYIYWWHILAFGIFIVCVILGVITFFFPAGRHLYPGDYFWSWSGLWWFVIVVMVTGLIAGALMWPERPCDHSPSFGRAWLWWLWWLLMVGVLSPYGFLKGPVVWAGYWLAGPPESQLHVVIVEKDISRAGLKTVDLRVLDSGRELHVSSIGPALTLGMDRFRNFQRRDQLCLSVSQWVRGSFIVREGRRLEDDQEDC